MDRRATTWQSLHKTLGSLPGRNRLVLAGGFNCACIPAPATCGNCIAPLNPAYATDYMDLANIMKSYNLCALNTWCKRQHTATYLLGQLETQIDFVMVKQSQVSGTVEKAGPITNYPVARWRDGARHTPVYGILRGTSPTTTMASTGRMHKSAQHQQAETHGQHHATGGTRHTAEHVKRPTTATT